jgi:pantothenate kinase-related protein Tda10
MITVIISAPQGIGKSRIAQMIIRGLKRGGFINFQVYTTNVELTDFINTHHVDLEDEIDG